MEGKYTFKEFNQNLDDGYQIFFTYVRNRYLLFKTAENCYTQKLLTDEPKNPQPRMAMVTYRRIKEMFPYMEDIEYKVGIPNLFEWWKNTWKKHIDDIELRKKG